MAFSFFKKNKEEEPNDKNRVQEIELSKIVPNQNQPRTIFSEESIAELADTIYDHGLLNPIVLRKLGDDQYEIIAGERRFRAVTKLGYEKVPAIVREMSDAESASLAIIENLQREGLTAVEEAKAYAHLMQLNELTQKHLAKEMGKSQGFVANKLRLLKLPTQVQDAILDRSITERHGRSLLTVEDEATQLELLAQIKENDWSVKETEAAIAALNQPKPEKKKKTKTTTKNVAPNQKVAVNTVKKAVQMVEKSGVKVNVTEEDTKEFYRIIIDIPVAKD